MTRDSDWFGYHDCSSHSSHPTINPNSCESCGCKISNAHNKCEFCNCNKRRIRREILIEKFFIDISSIAKAIAKKDDEEDEPDDKDICC